MALHGNGCFEYQAPAIIIRPPACHAVTLHLSGESELLDVSRALAFMLQPDCASLWQAATYILRDFYEAVPSGAATQQLSFHEDEMVRSDRSSLETSCPILGSDGAEP